VVCTEFLTANANSGKQAVAIGEAAATHKQSLILIRRLKDTRVDVILILTSKVCIAGLHLLFSLQSVLLEQQITYMRFFCLRCLPR